MPALALIGAVAGIASAGVSIAGAAGAFTPKQPSGLPSQSQVNAQIQSDETQLGQAQTQLETEQAEVSTANLVTYASLGLGALALGGGAWLLFKKKKK